MLNSNDSGAASLRDAVASANASGVADTIVFGDGSGSGGTNFLDAAPDIITLTSAQLDLTDSTTITGTGERLLTVSGNNTNRVFFVNNGDSAVITGMTITEGSGTTFLGGGGLLIDGGTVALTDCAISGNSGFGGGGLMAYNGTTTLTNCTVSGNSTTTNTGGGLYIRNGTATLTNFTVSGNSSLLIAGGVFSGNAATMINCIQQLRQLRRGLIRTVSSFLGQHDRRQEHSRHGPGAGAFAAGQQPDRQRPTTAPVGSAPT